ncbi:hypothetical protein [Microbacterium enclense]|uniref:DNA-binding protein n=1 Tax=Microbacterium enclense TaxID=993073 RepID=A0A1G6JEP3_9MICO|nr:hypothetical protein [Microbacterium enclense]KSU54828.1 hypothetical protein AS029_07730 [Microbacterium enclense]SDC17302.1 hypothetical protein SAMN05216418_1805 [Microbacterium enclense]
MTAALHDSREPGPYELVTVTGSCSPLGDDPSAWFRPTSTTDRETFAVHPEESDRRQLAAHLTEREVADLLHVPASHVHEMYEHELLAGVEQEGLVVYPQWQVTDDGSLLPHLTDVLHAASDVDSNALRDAMDAPVDDLDGVCPVQWLARGGPVEPVLRFLRDQDRPRRLEARPRQAMSASQATR